jgi:hypothetical protein
MNAPSSKPGPTSLAARPSEKSGAADQPDAWRHRCLQVNHAFSPLITTANRCLREPASRALDGAIHCAVLGVRDANSLTSAALIDARANGLILINHAAIKGWTEAPRYTEDARCANLLVPDGLSTIARDPRIVCATALIARATLEAPPLPLDGWRKHWVG